MESFSLIFIRLNKNKHTLMILGQKVFTINHPLITKINLSYSFDNNIFQLFQITLTGTLLLHEMGSPNTNIKKIM